MHSCCWLRLPCFLIFYDLYLGKLWASKWTVNKHSLILFLGCKAERQYLKCYNCKKLPKLWRWAENDQIRSNPHTSCSISTRLRSKAPQLTPTPPWHAPSRSARRIFWSWKLVLRRRPAIFSRSRDWPPHAGDKKYTVQLLRSSAFGRARKPSHSTLFSRRQLCKVRER